MASLWLADDQADGPVSGGEFRDCFASEAERDDDCYRLEFSCCSLAKDDAIHKEAQSGLSRANYY
jgi:hypothetical protein